MEFWFVLTMVYILTGCVLILPRLIEAMVITRYNIIFPQNGVDLISCGHLVGDFKYCACYVSKDKCEPLTSNWCGTMEIAPNTTFLIKEMVTETLENNPIYRYERDLPINLHTGSELQFQFTLHAGWERFVIDLMDNADNIVLHIKMQQTVLVFNTYSGYWGAEGRRRYDGTYSTVTEVLRTLKIVCTIDYFLISLDDSLDWKYDHRLPASSVRQVRIYSLTPVTLQRITYIAGHNAG